MSVSFKIKHFLMFAMALIETNRLISPTLILRPGYLVIFDTGWDVKLSRQGAQIGYG